MVWGGSDFETLSLAGSGLLRKPRIAEKHWQPDYLDRFDSDTLWLDAVWRDGVVRLICPRLNNLTQVVRDARFTLDGLPAQSYIRHGYRHTILTLPAPRKPERVKVTIGDWAGETAVSANCDAFFHGRNVLFTLSRNDDPAWIEDWVRFHVHHHGANAIAFVDNGSDRHSPEDIARAITRGGIKRYRLLHTPLRYGPRGKKPYANAELFLQTGVMNAVRWRYLWQARAVLGSDVDELIHWPGGSVFDAAAASRWGYVTVGGYWVYPAPGTSGRAGHAQHGYRLDPPEVCPPKWCMVPSGPFRRFEWRVHQLERLPFSLWFRLPDAILYHCCAVTTGWKSLDRVTAPERSVADKPLQMALTEANLAVRDA
jgi:hypothetical protein